MKKKIISGLLAVVFISLTACREKNVEPDNTTELKGASEEGAASDLPAAEVGDFAEVAHVDSYNQAAFSVNAITDPFVIYTQEDVHSKSVVIPVTAQNHFGSLYVFGESENFYQVHYQLRNEPRTTVRAYVPKSQFTKDSHQQIKADADLNQLRSMSIKDQEIATTSFKEYGELRFTDEATYKLAKNTVLTTPQAAIVENAKEIAIQGATSKRVLKKHSFEDEVETQLALVGYSELLHKVIVKEIADMETYYTFYDMNNLDVEPFHISGAPKLSPDKKRIVGLQNNSSVGIDFSLLDVKSGELIFDTYVNFVAFKLFSEKSYAWLNDTTLVVKVLHSNSLNTVVQRQEKDVKPQYITIKLY
ncbi:hypothetical protein [Flavobacterium sp. JP2137]|uniref:hypothetical protein n=1 Tax=Flavobacterium sp. JP2137 TaxID=3414510 RepID=UPI003D3006A1